MPKNDYEVGLHRQLLRENRERCDDEFPIGHRELELIRRDIADAEARRRLKPPNFAGEDH